MNDTRAIDDRALGRGEVILLLFVLLVGAVLRLAWNDVSEYSRADETIYLEYVRHLVDNGWASFPELSRRFIENPDYSVYPPPTRWGYIAISWLYCELGGSCGYRELATVSSIAGLASILFVFLLGREILGTRPALLAAALTVTSALQLAVGRRALVDEPFCALFLMFLWLLVRMLRSEERTGWLRVATLVAGTLAIGTKELFVFLYPIAILLLVFYRGRRTRVADLLVLAAPPLLNVAIFSALARSSYDFFRIAGIVTSAATAPYAEQYQNGPPHRPLFDLLILSPIVFLLMIGALAMLANRPAESTRGERWLALALVVTLGTFALLSSKNVRYIIVVDPLSRLLVASMIVRQQLSPRGWGLMVLLAVAAINGVVEIALFHEIFIVQKVYDPVTQNLLQALKALPH